MILHGFDKKTVLRKFYLAVELLIGSQCKKVETIQPKLKPINP